MKIDLKLKRQDRQPKRLKFDDRRMVRYRTYSERERIDWLSPFEETSEAERNRLEDELDAAYKEFDQQVMVEYGQVLTDPGLPEDEALAIQAELALVAELEADLVRFPWIRGTEDDSLRIKQKLVA